MFGRKAQLPDDWDTIVERVIPDWSNFSDDDQDAFTDALKWAYADVDWEPAGGFMVDDEMRLVLAAPVALVALGLDSDQLRLANRFIVWPGALPSAPDAVPVTDTLQIGGLKFSVHNDPYSVRLPLAISWEEVQAGLADPDLGRNPVLRAVALCIDLADEHVDGIPPLDDATRAAWLAVLEPIFTALDAGEERAPLEREDATDAGAFLGAITEAFFLCAGELRAYEPDLYALLAGYYGQDPAARHV